MGYLHTTGRVHVNGGAMYALDFSKYLPLTKLTEPWDIWVFKHCLAVNTPEIKLEYNKPTTRTIPDCALHHGVKDRSLLELVRRKGIL